MYNATYRSLYASYRKNPNIRMFTNFWYDGSPSELLLWRNRYMLRRLVLRAAELIAYCRERGYNLHTYYRIMLCDSVPSGDDHSIHCEVCRGELLAKRTEWCAYNLEAPVINTNWELVPYDWKRLVTPVT